MKRLSLISAAIMCGSPAIAADIPEYFEPIVQVPQPLPLWSGFYVGGQAGYAFQHNRSDFPAGFIRIPGTPGSPGQPANPGQPEIPPTPGSPEIVIPAGTYEFSFACAGVPDSEACAGSISRNGVVEQSDLTRAEISAAIAAIGGDPGSVNYAAAIVLELETEGRIIPEVPPTPGQPAIPPTPEVPAVPPTPEQIIDIDSLPGVDRFADHSDGFVGGVHAGYDFQTNALLNGGSFVWGALADISYADIRRAGGFRGLGQEVRLQQDLDYLATFRLRGGLAFDRTFFYATGGLALGRIETSYQNTFTSESESTSSWRAGYAIGAGTEYAATPNLHLGLEYLYTDLSSSRFERSYPITSDTTLNFTNDRDFTAHTIWLRASYRFN